MLEKAILAGKKKSTSSTRNLSLAALALSNPKLEVPPVGLKVKSARKVLKASVKASVRIVGNPPFVAPSVETCKFKQVDLFAGVGGIRLGFQKHGGRTVFSSEWDVHAKQTYTANYGATPHGDITKIDERDIPDHDILLAGFPCQPFSSAGVRRGFEDTRGTLFFDIARILKYSRPKAFMLENVKGLISHDKGRTLNVILNVLEELNYYVPDPEVLNSYHFGLPQNRERIIIVGFNKDYLPPWRTHFDYPRGVVDYSVKVGNILEDVVPDRFTLSDKAYLRMQKRKQCADSQGHGFHYHSFTAESKRTGTLIAGYYKDGADILIEQDGKNPRRLTPRECARLQGFPENFVISESSIQAYKQFGNSVSVPVIEAVAERMIKYMEFNELL